MRASTGGFGGKKENMTKEKETENRSERELFLDRMLKEILSGQRKPGDRLPTESELAEQYGLRKTNVHLGLQELERLGFSAAEQRAIAEENLLRVLE